MDISNLSKAHQGLLESLKKTIIDIDEAKALEVAREILDNQIDPNTAIKYAIADGAVAVGESSTAGSTFCPIW